MTVITLLLTGDVGLAWGTVTDFGAGERAPRVRDPSGEVHLTSEDRTNVPGNKLTRRGFLKAAGAGAAWIALTNTRSCAPAQRAPKVRSFRSRPDLSPPAVKVATQTPVTAPGYIFVAPKEGTAQNGPMIVDDRGELVWFRPLQNQNEYAMDFKVQHYKGEPVLTWCESRVVAGHGLGEYVIVDGSYREITRLKAGNGYEGDHHEFLITPHDTSLLTIYNPVRWDLSSVGGPKDGMALDGIVQEIDIESGEVHFEWHSLEHVGIEESYIRADQDQTEPFDYFHINSIDVDHDGNLLVSARKTFTVYKIDRKRGHVIWQLGGKKSSFAMGWGTEFRYQHDARRQPDGTITLFNNGSVDIIDPSCGLVLQLDVDRLSASLVRKYAQPARRHAATMGNMQVLPGGNVFIGWGSEPDFSEFTSDGDLVFDASFPPLVESYRAFRFPWSGHPSDRPVAVAERASEEEVRVYASWNGATQVATWEVLAGPRSGQLESLVSVPREGFETAMLVRTKKPYVVVRAKDRSGRVLGATEAVKQTRRSPS